MLTPSQWKARKKELENLKAKRDLLRAELEETSRQIHILSASITSYQKRAENPRPIKTDTFAYQMFGKRLKDLTEDEYRIYYNARQRINRAKRKEKLK